MADIRTPSTHSESAWPRGNTQRTRSTATVNMPDSSEAVSQHTMEAPIQICHR